LYLVDVQLFMKTKRLNIISKIVLNFPKKKDPSV
jgi:hypothetical protein